MNDHPDNAWSIRLLSHVRTLGASFDPGALRPLLADLAAHMMAERCAIVAAADQGTLVLEQSADGPLMDLAGLDIGDIWGGGKGTPSGARQLSGNRHVLELRGFEGGTVPLALVIEGVRGIDDATMPDLLAAAALLRLACAHLFEVQRSIARFPSQDPAIADETAAPQATLPDGPSLHTVIDRLTAAQALSVELINDLMSARHADLDAVVTSALGRMGAFCGSDRTYLFRETSETTISNTHEWCAPGIEPMIALLQDQPAEIAGPWFEVFAHQDHIYIADISTLDPEDEIRQVLEMQGIRSLLAVPLRHDGRFFGFVGYDAVREKRTFLKGEIHLIRSVANVMGTVLMQRDAELRLAASRAEQDMQRQRLRATLSAMPDVLLELDDNLRITGYHAHPGIRAPVDLHTLVGLRITKDFPDSVRTVAEQIRADLEDDAAVSGYSFAFGAKGTTRHYSVSAARGPGSVGTARPGYIAILRDVSEQHAQRLEIERLGRIAQTTTNLVVMTDPDGHIEWVNPAFEARTGFTLSEVIGKTPGSFLQSSETDKTTVRRIRQALLRRQPITCELLNVSRTGGKYWVSMTIQPVLDPEGALQGFMAVQTDTTASRLHAQELEAALAAEQAARAQLKSAVENMQEALILFDADQKLVICNDRYRSLYPGLVDMLHPGQSYLALMREALRQGVVGTKAADKDGWLQLQETKFRLRHSQFKLRNLAGRWYRETQQPTPDGGRICILSDVTEWKDAEQRALADRARAMDASRDGIVLAGADGLIRYANSAAIALFRRETPTALIGVDWLALIAGNARDDMASEVSDALSGAGFWQGHTGIALPDGTLVEIETSATRNSDQGILCIFRDITEKRTNEIERERLREELTLARRREEIGHLAAGLTHDFNNLLAVITGAATMIDETDSLDLARDLGKRITDASDQASGLLRRMLSLGKHETAREVLDLRRPLRDAAALIRPGLRAPLSLSIDVPDHPVMTSADSTSILQMVLNLAINARDALVAHPPEHGASRITLSLVPAVPADLCGPFDVGTVSPDLTYARISVHDNGPGMPADVAARIFTPYFSTKGSNGTGLGLPIVVNAVVEQGGALALETAPGQGTRFTILWPLGTDAEGSQETETHWQGQALLVLGLRDEEGDALAMLLEQAGALTVACRSVDEVAALLAEDETWDAVVLDAHDPGQAREAALALGAGGARIPVLSVVQSGRDAAPPLHEDRIRVCPGPLDRAGFLDDLHQARVMTEQGGLTQMSGVD